jgi:molybdenum cofactor cytidylyltransferase
MSSFGVVILAAGASSRMGRPKLTLPWRGSSILGHIIKTWTDLGAQQIAAVLSQANEAVETELDALEFPKRNRIDNPEPARGMFSSIQCAATWNGWAAALTHIVVALGDQPQISRGTLESLLRHVAQHPRAICQPSHHQRPRHPVAFPSEAIRHLASTSCASLKEFLESGQFERSFIEIADDSLDLDLDFPEEYARALQHYSRD